MNIFLLRKFLLLLCTLGLSLATTRSEVINSTYIGAIGGNWSDPDNWSPPIVPRNSKHRKFNVSVESEYPGMNLDIDVRLKRLTLTGDGSTVNAIDHSLRSPATSLGVDFPHEQFGGGFLYAIALTTNVIADLGNLVDFSGTTFKTGQIAADASAADPGITATVQFNGADIRATDGYIGIFGANSRIVDEQGHDALAHLEKTFVDGILDVETGREFTTGGSLANEGATLVYSTGFIGPDAPATLVIAGDYTGIGYPLDPGTVGLLKAVAPGPQADARIVITGHLTNYDPTTQTLNKTYFVWSAANGASATTKVLGGSQPLDIVTSRASLNLFGPHTGFRDKFGNDALRNLSTSARLLLGDRNFTTANDFTSTSRLSIFGDTRFTVSGNLTIRNGFFEVSPLTGYAREGEFGFPTDPPYISSKVIVRGNFNLNAGTEFLAEIVANPTLPKITVRGSARLHGDLIPLLFDEANPTSSDSFTVLTAGRIVGQFSNVASGERVPAFSYSDGSELGTFLVTYGEECQERGHRREVVLSDFQPSSTNASSPESRTDASQTSKRRFDYSVD